MSEFLGPVMGGLAQVLGMAQAAGGGWLTGMITQLENAGLTAQVQSWVGEGENLPVTEAELERAFSREELEKWAAEAGTTPEALLKVLAEALPQAVDRATPGGKVP